MVAHKKRKIHATARANTVHGVVFVVTALLGAQACLSSGLSFHRGARNDVVVNSAAAPAAIFDSTGLLGVTGATVLLLMWLQRQAARRCTSLVPIFLSRPPARFASNGCDSQRRHLNSLRVGGRHGP